MSDTQCGIKEDGQRCPYKGSWSVINIAGKWTLQKFKEGSGDLPLCAWHARVQLKELRRMQDNAKL